MFSVATLCCQIERTLSALPNKLRVLSALGVLALRGGARILGFSRMRVNHHRLLITGAIAILKSVEPAHCSPNNQAKDQGYLYSSELFTRMFFELVS